MGMPVAMRSDPPALPSDWRARLQRRLLAQPDHAPDRYRYGALHQPLPQAALAPLRAQLPAALDPAAVLVPILDGSAGPSVLLTVRASHLRAHAGQVSFPGGRLEADDRDIAAAAIRETAEEIGIAAASIEPLGFLTDHVVLSGYRITPLVALVRAGYVLAPDIAEVAGIFELPLAVVLDPHSYRGRRRLLGGVELETQELPHGPHRIWGATAGILMHLRELIVASAP